MKKPKFKIGQIVKQNPTGLVKKIIAIEYHGDYGSLSGYYYALDDSFGWEPEFKLNETEETRLSRSIFYKEKVKGKNEQR